MTLNDLVGKTIDGIQLDNRNTYIRTGDTVLVMHASAGCGHMHVFVTPFPIHHGSELTPIIMPCKAYIAERLPMFTPFVPALPGVDWEGRQN